MSAVTPIMKCGCAAQAQRKMPDGTWAPSCITHHCIEVAPAEPDLTGRKARCTYYGCRTAARGSYGGGNECNYGQSDAAVCTCEQPSSKELPFFEFCGIGSHDATHCKHCGYYESVHKGGHTCTHYEPRGPAMCDRFYCGCHGWD